MTQDELVFKSEKINIGKGKTFLQRGDQVEKVCFLVKGQMTAKNDYARINLANGALIGVLDMSNGEYIFDYEAQTDCMLLAFDFAQLADVKRIFGLGKTYQELSVTSICSQFQQLYQVYEKKFLPYAGELQGLTTVSGVEAPIEVNETKCNYLCEITSLSKPVFHELFSGSEVIAFMHILTAAELSSQINSAALSMLSILDGDLFALEDEEKEEPANNTMENDDAEEEEEQVEKNPERALEDLANSLSRILAYAELDAAKAAEFQVQVAKYRKLPDRNSSDNDVRMLRKQIAENFYDIYEKVFIKQTKDSGKDRIIEMFLTFGYMDEKFFNKETLVDLYYYRPHTESEKYHIFTIYEWLMAIYNGKREPSKNEYDLDYKENLRELKKSRQFTTQEENEYLTDQDNKVRFEIQNLLRITGKLTSGELTTFCPILSQHSFDKGIAKMFLSAKRVETAIDKLLAVDFSLFHREHMYYAPEHKIDKIVIQKQVFPDIILMPNSGTRSVMWQDISEKKRDTPARFIMPEFVLESIDNMVISMAATFRWELCRTVQGNYWNDLRDRSLTSEYFDYVQFYRKNKELTEEAKTKIKSQFQRCRNSYREMFVKDYEVWVKYESQGSMRLNKVARRIMYTYCPFAAQYRSKLEQSPAFVDASQQYQRDRLKKIKETNNFINSVTRKGGDITKELSDLKEFYEDL